MVLPDEHNCSSTTARPDTALSRRSPPREQSPLTRTRSATARERINNILEIGQKRAEALDFASSNSVSNHARGASPGRHRAPAVYGSYGDSAVEAESSGNSINNRNNAPLAADETTGIVSRDPGVRNYHATSATSPPSPPPCHRHQQRKQALSANGAAESNLAPTTSARSQSQSRRSTAGTAGAGVRSGAGVVSGSRQTEEPGRIYSQSSSTYRKLAGWLKSLGSQFHSIELENKGSVARDHLAIERTFLAWLRTSLAFASIGVAVTQLFRLNTGFTDGSPAAGAPSDGATLRRLGKPLGATFLGISILVLLLGYKRYVSSQQWVMRGKFPASRGTIVIVSAVAFALIVASLVVVVAVQPFESELVR